MSKFKRVLGDYDLRALLGDGLILDEGSVNHVRDIEQRVLSKVAEQDPIGYLHANGISFLSSRRTTAEQARAEDYNIPLYAHPMPAIKQEPIAWIFEDELPSDYPYELMFEYSKVDGVRMYPVYAPKYDGGSHD